MGASAEVLPPHAVPETRHGQFLVGPTDGPFPAGWPRVRLDARRTLATHPTLSVAGVHQGNRSLHLVGFMLDPDRPEAGDREILNNLLPHFTRASSLIRATARLGGRWLLIALRPGESLLFHDALGLRQAFYTDPRRTNHVWVMSQPGTAADCLGLTMGEAQRRFADSHAFRGNRQYRWPGEATPFDELRHLLPNHYLDLDRGWAVRYWPAHPLPPTPPDKAVLAIGRRLKGMVEAAHRRFDLAMGITAGLDSRLALAAARPIAEKIAFVTVRQQGMDSGHQDIAVPRRMLRTLGLSHKLLRATAMSTRFRSRYERSVFMAHEHYGGDAEAILRALNREKAVLTGSGAEVGRCSFRDHPAVFGGRRVTPASLCRLQYRAPSSFAARWFARWLDSVPARRRHGIHLLDLFEWEQGHGNWLAMTQQEFDIAWKEMVTPYNCRQVLELLLSVPEAYRRGPEYRIFIEMIRRLWPELADTPINPAKAHRPKHRLKRAARSILFLLDGTPEPRAPEASRG